MARSIDYGNLMHRAMRGLIQSVPSSNVRGRPLHQIPGMTPSLLELAPGCPFRTRCERASARCADDPPLTQRADGRNLRCFHPHEEAITLRAGAVP